MIVQCIVKIQNNNLSDNEIARISSKIGFYKKVVQNTFIETQNKIFTSHFNKRLNNLYSTQDIEDFRKKLYGYKNLIGVTENYTYFNDYYINMMVKLDEVYERITGETSLLPYRRSIWQIITSKIASLLGIREKETENAKII